MDIIVCAKFIQGELNPFDAAALECALEIAENTENISYKKHTQVTKSTPNTKISILAMGPISWIEPMTRLTRLGRNANLRAILLSDPTFASSDTLATSRILAKAIQKLTSNSQNLTLSCMTHENMHQSEISENVWVFCGRQTIDGDTAQVGPELSVLLRWHLATNCMELPNVFGASVGDKIQ
ncbi:MAG: hypothetical protein Q4C70_05315, partial [Planctomycetia bacterium]|nr:hypothetical protein [Planctomycetia bacterium]